MEKQLHEAEILELGLDTRKQAVSGVAFWKILVVKKLMTPFSKVFLMQKHNLLLNGLNKSQTKVLQKS